MKRDNIVQLTGEHVTAGSNNWQCSLSKAITYGPTSAAATIIQKKSFKRYKIRPAGFIDLFSQIIDLFYSVGEIS